MSIIFLIACSNSVQDSEQEEIQVLTKTINDINKRDEDLPTIQKLSNLFFQYMSVKDFEKVKDIMTEHNTIDNNGNITFKENNEEVIYTFDQFNIYKTQQIPNLRFFILEDDEYTIGYSYFLQENEADRVINLTFIKENNTWQLDRIYMDA